VLVLTVFVFNCWMAWAMLNVLSHVRGAGRVLPAFTNFWIDARLLLLFMPIVLAGFGMWLWFRRTENARASGRFVLIAMAVLIVLVFPPILTSFWLFVGPMKALELR